MSKNKNTGKLPSEILDYFTQIEQKNIQFDLETNSNTKLGICLRKLLELTELTHVKEFGVLILNYILKNPHLVHETNRKRQTPLYNFCLKLFYLYPKTSWQKLNYNYLWIDLRKAFLNPLLIYLECAAKVIQYGGLIKPCLFLPRAVNEISIWQNIKKQMSEILIRSLPLVLIEIIDEYSRCFWSHILGNAEIEYMKKKC